MSQVKASEFKAKCLALMDEVARTGRSITITKNGQPVADLVPHRSGLKDPLGILKGRLVITGDIMSPVGVSWNAQK